MKDADIGRFVKGPHPRHAKSFVVNLSDRLAKGKHAVKEVKLKAQNLICVGVCAVMRVMEQRAEAKTLLARKYLLHHLRLIPLMNQDEISVRKFVIEKSRQTLIAPVEANVKFGICSAEAVNGALPGFTLPDQIAQRPRPDLLIAANLVPHAHQFARQPAQKMSVAMVPVADPRVREKADAQGPIHAAPTRRSSRAL